MNALLETFLTHVMPLVSIENIINPEAFREVETLLTTSLKQ